MSQNDDRAVVTFGCRLNTVESEAIQEVLADSGREDVVVINTCAVTREATRQALQTVRRLKRRRPQTQIIVTGCGAQVETEAFIAAPEVDKIVRNDAKNDLALWREILNKKTVSSRVVGASGKDVPFHANVTRFSERTRAFLQIQNGCDHRCTFCIIPYARGASRSVPIETLIETARALAKNHAEIVLTGVDITSYGLDLEGRSLLAILVSRILDAVPDLLRLRLSSIDCVEMDAALVTLMGQEKRLAPHLHLSLQSGDDMILKRMKRRHNREDVIRFCDAVREKRPDVVFGADVIVGFPTETEAMFQQSVDLVERCDLASLHVFPFSPRPGTPAARMPQTPLSLVKERAAILREKGAALYASHLRRKIGQRVRVLAETPYLGRTEHFMLTRVATPVKKGALFDAQVAGVVEGRLTVQQI